MNVLITTYNRKKYLEKCIWSIVASGANVDIYVGDDGSKDGTIKLIEQFIEKGIVKGALFKKGLGTARLFNALIDSFAGDIFVIANDDMWFHRGWREAAEWVYNTFYDAAAVTFFDYTRLNKDEGNEIIFACDNYSVMKVYRTGMAACMLSKEAFKRAGGFYLPEGRKMGFFTTPFCQQLNKLKGGRNKHYAVVRPSFATHMDYPKSKLQEREYAQKTGYAQEKSKHKHGKK